MIEFRSPVVLVAGWPEEKRDLKLFLQSVEARLHLWLPKAAGDRRGVMNACEKLTERFETMKRNGLKDVKFLFHNTDDCTEETLCEEVLTMLNAYESGKYTKLEVVNSGRKQ